MPSVLIVDDERFIAETIGLILKKCGARVLVAHSGEEAVPIASAEKPDWMVSDVVMGEMSGIDAAIQISALSPRTRIILMSGNAVTTDLLAQARADGHEFEILAKPFPPDELIRRILA